MKSLTLFAIGLAALALWTIESSETFLWECAPGTYQLQVTTFDLQVGFVPRMVVGDAEPRDEVEIEPRPSASVTLVHAATGGTRALRLFVDGAPFTMPPMDDGNREGLLAGTSETLLVPAGELRAELLEGERVVASETVTLLPDEHRRILLEPR